MLTRSPWVVRRVRSLPTVLAHFLCLFPSRRHLKFPLLDMPCGLTAVLLGWPQVSCMSQPANMAAANQGAPFSRFLAFATPLVHQFTPYFSWTHMKLDLLKNPTHPPPLLGWKWGHWAAVYNKCAKCRPMPSFCGSHWYIGGWVYVRVTIQARSLFEVFEPGNIRFAPASLWF